MSWFLVGGALVILGAVTMIALFIVSAPRLASLPARRTRHTPREAAVKERILMERLLRRFRASGDATVRHVQAVATEWRGQLQKWYRRLRLLAQEHRVPAGEERTLACPDFLAQAADAMHRESFEEAEDQYLACLKIDAKHRDAYVGLAALYRKRKETALAEETLQFLRRLCPDDAEVMMELAEILYERGKEDAAVKQVRAALVIAPKNPRYLDFALELALVKRHVNSARKYLEQLRATNPDNQKLVEFEERVGAL